MSRGGEVEMPGDFGSRAVVHLAGFVGALVYALRYCRGNPVDGIIACVIGGLSAGYISPDIANWFPSVSREFAGFAVGFFFYGLSDTVLLVVRAKISKMSK